jgi:hypothetical protein
VKTFLIILWRFVKALPLVLVFPILLLIAMASLAAVDLACSVPQEVASTQTSGPTTPRQAL